MTVRIALDDAGDILGGIVSELYPRSRCGLITYLVVAPRARERGLGRQLLDEAARSLYDAGAIAVLGEVNDPRVHGESARPRLERFQRWGARKLDVPYVQPSLGEGLPRDRGLILIVLPPAPATVEHGTIHTFITELYEATEGSRETL
jgi:GNAT superfamily N-acetyltransferase